MGDHYCCRTCHQRYERCTCDTTKQTERRVQAQPKPPEVPISIGFPSTPIKIADPVHLIMEDIRYFHDKLQRYGDEKSAQQLMEAVNAFLEAKGK